MATCIIGSHGVGTEFDIVIDHYGLEEDEVYEAAE